MNCQELAIHLEKAHPKANPQEVARLCLLLTTTVEELETLREPESLNQAWKTTCLRLQAATDQHAAMTVELEHLANSDPKEFSKDQVWTLIRAIKVQSQILEMYIGQPAIDV